MCNSAITVVCLTYITLAVTRGTTETTTSVVSVNSVMQNFTLITASRTITNLAYSNFVVAKVYRALICNIVDVLDKFTVILVVILRIMDSHIVVLLAVKFSALSN